MSRRAILLGWGGALERELAERIWDPDQLLLEVGGP